jgi:hypothetical protein
MEIGIDLVFGVHQIGRFCAWKMRGRQQAADDLVINT